MSRALILTRKGSPENFQLQEVSLPAVSEDGVRVRVHCAGVNFADSLMMLGAYADAPPLPAAPGYEVAGEVVEAGVRSQFRVGERVAGLTLFGGYADEVVVRDAQLVKIPEGLDYAQAASLPVAYLTAAVALQEMCRVRKGDKVLVHGGAGGVGRMALNICRQLGAEAFATASSDDKLQTAREAGATHVINYRTHNFATEVLRFTQGEGVHAILDAVGGRNVPLDVKCLAKGGRVVLYGIADAMKNGKFSLLGLVQSFVGSLRYSPMLLMNRNIGFFGLNLLKYQDEHGQPIARRYLQQGFDWASQGVVQPFVSKEYPLAEGGKALAEILSGRTTGKLILRCR